MTELVRVAVSKVVGQVTAQAALPVPRATVAVSRVVGAVAARAYEVRQTQGAITRVVGRVAPLVLNWSDVWTAAGFPIPNREGYGYARRYGLVHTKMRSGKTRQRRKWVNGYGEMTVVVDIPLDQLDDFEASISGYSYAWFTMPLITGANLSSVPEAHNVRIVGDLRYENIFGKYIRVTMPLEYQVKAPAYIIIPRSAADASAKGTAPTLYGGTYSQTTFPFIILAVATIPSVAVTNEKYITLQETKATVPTLLGGKKESLTQDTKVSAPTLLAGGTFTNG